MRRTKQGLELPKISLKGFGHGSFEPVTKSMKLCSKIATVLGELLLGQLLIHDLLGLANILLIHGELLVGFCWLGGSWGFSVLKWNVE